MISRRTAYLSAVTAIAVLAFGQGSRRQQWNRPQEPFQVIGNIYYVGTAGLGSYLITTPAGNMLLDGALPESAPLIERNVETLGFHMRDVKYLLNTHAHYDHAGGLAALKKASGAKMVASAADAVVLNSGIQGSYGAGWDSRFPAAHVDKIVSDGEQLSLGGTTLTAHITPGHTKGCTTWTTTVTEGGIRHNVVFYCSTSVPGYPLLHNRYYPQIVDDYRHSFAILKTLSCDVFLANHTEFFDMEDKLKRRKAGAPNPFVDSTEFQKYVAASEAEFNATLQSQQEAAAKRKQKR
jgi:metallo-beta-lactamase class B